MNREAGKGDAQRPTNWDHFSENFSRIFGETAEDWKAEDEEFERVKREQDQRKEK
jgi:hypothetical protein